MTKKIFLSVFIMLLITGSFHVYAQKINFLTSSTAPAARGYVRIKKDSNKNYKVRIELWNLTEVDRLQPSRQTYVIWMVTEGATKNMGRLRSSTVLFSKKLRADFETISAFKPSKVFITAEDDANCSYPTMQSVLTTDSF